MIEHRSRGRRRTRAPARGGRARGRGAIVMMLQAKHCPSLGAWMLASKLLIVVLLQLMPSSAARGPLRAPEQRLVALERGVVTATCPNPQDCTETLLQALTAEGASLVIVPHIGRHWLVRPLTIANQAASHRTIQLEQGVELLAMDAPSFHWPMGGALLTITNASNVTVRGGTIRMRRSEYADPTKYNHSEYRHGLSLRGCEDITIEQIHITETGGDGLYINGNELHSVGNYRGYSRNVALRNVVSTHNYRQGMSVCGAVNLLVEDCTFSWTNGTAPMAGIDFEPNNALNRLRNITVRRCTFQGNTGHGLRIGTNRLVAKTSQRAMAPTSYVFEDLNITGGGLAGFGSGGRSFGGGGLYIDNMGEGTAAVALTLRRIHISNTSSAGLQFEGTAADKTAVTLEKVTLTDVATNFGRQLGGKELQAPPNSLSPIVLGDPKYGNNNLDFLVGTLAFGDGCVIRDAHRRPFLSFVAGNGSAGVAGLTGCVTVINPRHPKACHAHLPDQGLKPWGEGDGLLDLSLQIGPRDLSGSMMHASHGTHFSPSNTGQPMIVSRPPIDIPILGFIPPQDCTSFDGIDRQTDTGSLRCDRRQQASVCVVDIGMCVDFDHNYSARCKLWHSVIASINFPREMTVRLAQHRV